MPPGRDDDDGGGRGEDDDSGVDEGTAKLELTVGTRTLVRVALVAIAAWAAVALALALLDTIVLLALALFLTMALDPAVQRLERAGVPRAIASFAAVISLVAVVVGAGWIFADPLIEQGREFGDRIPELADRVAESEVAERIGLAEATEQLADRASSSLTGWVGTGLTWTVGVLADTFILLGLTLLALVSAPSLVRATIETVPDLARRRWWIVLSGAYRSTSRYVAGSAVMATIAGTLTWVTLSLLDVPQPLPLALWVALLSFVPIIGAFIGGFPAFIVALVDDWWKGLLFLALMTAYQQLEGSVLSPAVLGRAVRISPLVVLVAIVVGGSLLGVPGVILAVPAAGTLQIALREYREHVRRAHPEAVERARERMRSTSIGDGHHEAEE